MRKHAEQVQRIGMIGVGSWDLAIASFGVGEATGLIMRDAEAQVIGYAGIAECLMLLALGICSTLMAVHAPNLQERRLSTSRDGRAYARGCRPRQPKICVEYAIAKI